VRSDADVVISVGPTYTQAEHDALFGQLASEVQLVQMLIDAAQLQTTVCRVLGHWPLTA
jgi:hypothetical protein